MCIRDSFRGRVEWRGSRNRTRTGGRDFHVLVLPAHVVDVVANLGPTLVCVIARIDDGVVRPREILRVPVVGQHLFGRDPDLCLKAFRGGDGEETCLLYTSDAADDLTRVD